MGNEPLELVNREWGMGNSERRRQLVVGLADEKRMKGDDLAERLLGFASRVLGVVGRLSAHPTGRYVAGQLARAGTAPGALYEEARRAESRADFVHKTRIAAKEASESVYWLRLAERNQLVEGDLGPLIQEGNELTAILAASVRTARKR